MFVPIYPCSPLLHTLAPTIREINRLSPTITNVCPHLPLFTSSAHFGTYNKRNQSIITNNCPHLPLFTSSAHFGTYNKRNQSNIYQQLQMFAPIYPCSPLLHTLAPTIREINRLSPTIAPIYPCSPLLHTLAPTIREINRLSPTITNVCPHLPLFTSSAHFGTYNKRNQSIITNNYKRLSPSTLVHLFCTLWHIQ